MIVVMKGPSNVRKVIYGEITMLMNPDDTVEVPRYLGKALLAKGFTTDADLSAVETGADISKGDAWEAHYMLQAHGGKPGDPETTISAALALFNKYGEPKITLV